MDSLVAKRDSRLADRGYCVGNHAHCALGYDMAGEEPARQFQEKVMEAFKWNPPLGAMHDLPAKMIYFPPPHMTVPKFPAVCEEPPPTIDQCFEDFKSRIARDELPGEG